MKYIILYRAIGKDIKMIEDSYDYPKEFDAREEAQAIVDSFVSLDKNSCQIIEVTI